MINQYNLHWGIGRTLVSVLFSSINLTRVPGPNNNLLFFYSFFTIAVVYCMVSGMRSIYYASEGELRQSIIKPICGFWGVMVVLGFTLNWFVPTSFFGTIALVLIGITLGFARWLIKSKEI